MPASLLKTKDLAALISARAKEMGFSEAQLSDRVAGHPSLVSDIKRGRMPSFGRLQEIARVLDFELYFGPRRGPLNKASDHLIPHKGFARCGPDGWGRPVDRDDLPGPAELIDDQVFFVEAVGFSMVPEGIKPGDFVLVSPARIPVPGDRLYIEDREGRAAIKRLLAIDQDMLFLRGWQDPLSGKFQSFEEKRVRDYVRLMAPVIAVLDRRPVPGEPLSIRPDPRVKEELAVATDVPLLGYAAAGSVVVFADALSGEDRVPAPPGVSASLGALEARGLSMEPAIRDRDVIYYRTDRSFDPEECVGLMVVATAAEGETYVKLLRRGDKAGTWNLESVGLNEPTMPNISLERVAPIEWVHCRGRFQSFRKAA